MSTHADGEEDGVSVVLALMMVLLMHLLLEEQDFQEILIISYELLSISFEILRIS